MKARNSALVMFATVAYGAGVLSGVAGTNAAHASTRPPPLISAHRGSYAGGPVENSLKGFKVGAKYAEIMETDIRETKDHKLFLMHDATINRTTKSKGTVAKMTYKQLKKVKLKDGQPIPTLLQYVNVIRSTHSYALVEIKTKLSSSGWSQLNRRLKVIKPKVIIYSSVNNAYAAEAHKRYGYAISRFQWAKDGKPTINQILAFGKYVHAWRASYTPAELKRADAKGIRWIGATPTHAGYLQARKIGQWAVSTDNANKLR